MDHQRDTEEVLASAKLRLSSEIGLAKAEEEGGVTRSCRAEGSGGEEDELVGEQRTYILKNIIIFGLSCQSKEN